MSQLEEYLFKADDASLFNVEEPMFKIDEPSIHMANTSRNEPLDWDSFKCLRHPSFKVDALYIDESGCYDPKLLCMKCIIEEDCFSGPRKFITVKDLREYYIDSLTKSIPSGEDLSSQNFNEIFMDFYQQNYVTTYEKHIKSQFDIVSSEIDNIINDLTQLKEKYKDFYSTELVEHSFKAEEVKKNVKKYFDEKGDTQAFDASQLSAQFNSMKTNDDYCRFLRKLYYLSKEVKEDTGKSYCYVQTLQKIDQLKNKALNLEENRANVDYLQEIRKMIQMVLKSGSLLFKARKGIDVLVDKSNISKNIQVKTEQPASQSFWGKQSANRVPFSEQIVTSFEPYQTENISMKQENASRPFMERRKEFKKYRYSEIDSHSLRNLYKSIIEKENSDPTSDEKITKDTLDSLHDWVNRRITGYLIFRNTISENDDEELKHSSELGIHANHHIGQKWKQLTTKEKKEYQDLARSYRKLFKEEVIIPENYSDLIELLETVDVKIKKIKKEE